jgi:hypothetical protein
MSDIKPTLNSYDNGGPFGDSDASRVDFHKLRSSYVNIINDNNDDIEEAIDTSVRVIVGRKGSGKTLYIRTIQDHYRRLNFDSGGTVYITDIDNEPPDTNLIVKVTTWFEEKEAEADEIWRRIWKIVILRTTYTHLFYSPDLQKYVTQKQKTSFIDKYRSILPSAKVATSVFNQLTSFLANFNSEHNLKSFLYKEEWAAFETELNNLIKQSPPIYFFLDQLDDDFIHAPYQWLKCQYGLFACMFRFIRNNTFGGRLHIVACIREIVYSYILHTQDGTKYLSESKIKILRWDSELAEHFLEKKIQVLDDKYFIDPTSPKTTANFFGLDTITLNRGKGFNEKVASYILRHTMLMPRDIINVGNIFCEKKQLNKNLDNRALLKDAVGHVARQIAKEQTVMASILIINKWIYNGIIEDENFDFFVNEQVIQSVNKELCRLIKKIGKDRFTNKLLKNIENKLEDFRMEESDRPFNALFLAGLLGYIEKDAEKNIKEVFFSESRNTQFSLPDLKKNYVLHSSLIDYLEIKPIGKPVYA